MRQRVQAQVFIVGTLTLMSVLGVAASANAKSQLAVTLVLLSHGLP